MEYHAYEVTDMDAGPSLTGPKWRAFMWPLAACCVISVPSMLAFPVLMYANGGAAFLIPFGACTLVLLMPMVFVQVKLGGITNANMITMFGRSVPILKGVGVAMLIYLSISSVIEAMTAAYSIFYAYQSVVGKPLLWQQCGQEWNTPLCRGPRVMPLPGNTSIAMRTGEGMHPNTSYTRNVRSIRVPPSMTPAEEYFLYEVTKIPNSEGFGDFRALLPLTAACLGIFWFAVFLVSCWGPRIFGWLILILSLASFSIMFLLIGRGHQGLKDYATHGMAEFYRPTWDQLQNPDVWFKAFVLSLSLTGVVQGTLPTFGKFIGNGKCSTNMAWFPMALFVVALPNTFVIMLSPFMSFLSKVYDKPFFQLMGPTEKIIFHNIPDMASLMPSGILSFFFYLWIVLHSIIRMSFVVIVLLDSVVEGFRDVLERVCSRKFVARLPVCALICLILFLLGLPLATEGGLYLAYLVTWFSSLLMALTYLLACVGFSVTYVKQTKLSLCQRVVVTLFFCILSLVLVVTLAVVAYQVVDKLPLKMPSGYVYPESSNWFGWLVAGGPLLFGLMAGIVHALVTASGNCAKKVSFLFRGAPVPKRRTKRREKVVMRPVGGLGGPRQPLMTDKMY